MAKRDMLINYAGGEECRIAISVDGRLEEIYQERARETSHVGNIYKGKVTNVEPAIQAAFVDFGLERNGFLHITDLHPKYFPKEKREETERVGSKTPRRERPPIQKCLRRGQEILVQVLKEGIGTKGPTLTSYLSIPGRFLVMMPFMERLGVSRKMEDDEARRAARDALKELNPPKEFGFIVRTAGIGRTKTELKRDLAYLTRLWKAMDARCKQLNKPGELYAESDLLIRTLRDIYSTDIDRVIVDDPVAARRATDFLAIASPRSGPKRVWHYNEPIPIFHRYGIEEQIESIHASNVPLPSGGSLVIEATEALVAIDVNSGKMRNEHDAEVTAYKTNLEACDEICRQLRLRDLGGVVVCDLIDMRATRHRRGIEQRFRDNLKNDRARTRTLAISQFGILEMTRQRMRPSLTKSVYTECPHCHGEGVVKSADSVVLDVMRRLVMAAHNEKVARIDLTVSPDIAFILLNRRRNQLVAIEQRYGKPILVKVNPSGAVDYISMEAFDARGSSVEVMRFDAKKAPQLDQVDRSDEPPAEDDESLELMDELEDVQADVVEPPTPAGYQPMDKGDPSVAAEEQEAGGGKKKRRRRRRRRKKGDQQDDSQQQDQKPQSAQQADAEASHPAHPAAAPATQEEQQEIVAAVEEARSQQQDAARGDGQAAQGDQPSTEEAPRKKRRRRGGRSRRKKKGGEAEAQSGGEAKEQPAESKQEDQKRDDDGRDEAKRDDSKRDEPKRDEPKRDEVAAESKTPKEEPAESAAAPSGEAKSDGEADESGKGKKKVRRGRRRKKSVDAGSKESDGSQSKSEKPAAKSKSDKPSKPEKSEKADKSQKPAPAEVSRGYTNRLIPAATDKSE